ncbi:TPR repeat [Seinonella peptonophila]|uniref:TPR repeat n=1 Tax=Seinonella peptonophila TaxID=112248 RepID=A0A1M4ZP65_9BACL|nr:tetratricopeptide repeat protein [Seinonella peptonophila]SHF19587.1 TPR repeat [Seinonella peptonophila]
MKNDDNLHIGNEFNFGDNDGIIAIPQDDSRVYITKIYGGQSIQNIVNEKSSQHSHFRAHHYLFEAAIQFVLPQEMIAPIMSRLNQLLLLCDQMYVLSRTKYRLNIDSVVQMIKRENQSITREEFDHAVENWVQLIKQMIKNDHNCIQIQNRINDLRNRFVQSDQNIQMKELFLALCIQTLDESFEAVQREIRRHTFFDPIFSKNLLHSLATKVEKRSQEFQLRYSELEEIQKKLNQNHSGKYILLTGRRETGKTFLINKLIHSSYWDEQRTVAPWLPQVVFQSGVGNVKMFIQSLLEQLNMLIIDQIKWVPDDEMFAEDVDVMVRYEAELRAALQEVVNERGKIIVVIDGLDEVSPYKEDFRFLPTNLPEGVTFLVSACKNSAAEQWLLRHHEYCVEHLSPVSHLHRDQVAQLLEISFTDRVGQAFVDKVMQKTAGIALLVFPIARDLQRLEKKYSKVEVYDKKGFFERLAEKWRIKGAPKEVIPILSRVHQLLAIFQPIALLDFDMIKLFLRVCGDQLPDVKRYLDQLHEQLEGDVLREGVKLYVEAYADFVRQKFYGLDMEECFQYVIRWLLEMLKPKYLNRRFGKEKMLGILTNFLEFWMDKNRLKKEWYAEEIGDELIKQLGHQNADLLFQIAKYNNTRGIDGYRSGFRFKCIVHSALLRHTNAMRLLGVILIANRKIEEGRIWLSRAANAGDISSMIFLGSHYIDHPPVDQRKGKEWLERAIQKGSSKGMVELGTRLLKGNGLPKDLRNGLCWIEQAANLGSIEAMMMLILNGDELREIGFYIDQEYWFKKGCDAGNIQAIYLYAKYLLEQKRDIEEGERLLMQAADSGYQNAMLDLAKRYLTGDLLKRNPEKGKKYIYRAAKKGYPQAILELAICLLDGQGLPQQKEEGQNWLNLAVEELKYQPAIVELGIRLLDGRGYSQDLRRGRKLLKQSFEDPKAKFEIGSRMLDGRGFQRNVKLGRRYLKKTHGRNRRYPRALCEVGVRYLDGDGLDVNQSMGRYWLDKGITSGHQRSMLEMGVRLLEGEGLPQNIENGRKLILRAAKLGNLTAMLELGIRLLDGNGFEQDIVNGEKWIHKTALRGFDAGKLELGVRLLDGNGLMENIEEGRKWLIETAEKGDLHAMLECGERYLEGNKFPLDMKEGRKWLERANRICHDLNSLV